MNNISLLCTTLLLCTQIQLRSQSIDYQQAISSHIELPKDTVLLGEPVFFDFVITNVSNDTFYVEQGDEFEIPGAPWAESFVFLVDEKQDTIQNSIGCAGYSFLIGFAKFEPGQKRVHHIFLPEWAEITQVGSYKIIAGNQFKATTDHLNYKESRSKATIVPKQEEAILTVVDNQQQLGEFINQLIIDIKTAQPKDEYKYDRILEKITDERIIPFLSEAFLTNQFIKKEKANYLLSQFPCNDLAFETLKTAVQSPENARCFISDDSISLGWSSSYIRQNAIAGIMNRNDTEAVDFVISRKNSDSIAERYGILTRSTRALSPENAQKVCLAFLDDPHPAIRKKAAALLKSSQKRTGK